MNDALKGSTGSPLGSFRRSSPCLRDDLSNMYSNLLRPVHLNCLACVLRANFALRRWLGFKLFRGVVCLMSLPGPSCEIGAYSFKVTTTTHRGPGQPDSFNVECTHRPTGVVWKVTHLLVFPILPPPGPPPPAPQQLVADPPLQRVDSLPPQPCDEGPTRTPPVAGGVVAGEGTESKRLALCPKYRPIPPPPPLLPQPPPPKWPAEPPLAPKVKEHKKRKRSRSRRRRAASASSGDKKEPAKKPPYNIFKTREPAKPPES